MKHKANCHCGVVKLEFEAPRSVEMLLCNCSICDMTGYKHINVPHENVSFISGKDQLSTYRFGSHIAKHFFCQRCGIKPLYQPRSHPDHYSINYRCVVGETLSISNIVEFDGQNWEKNVHNIRDKKPS